MLAGGAVLAALLPAAAVAAPTSPAPVAASQEAPVRGVIVQGSIDAERAADVVGEALPAGAEVSETRGGPGGATLVQVDVALDVDEAQAVAQEVAGARGVELAVPNYEVRPFGAPPTSTDDPAFASQHNLWDARASSPGGYSVKAPSFWGTTRGSADTVVAVLDTGVDLTHPDLQGQLVPGYDLVDDEFTCAPSGACSNRGTFINAGDRNGLDGDPSDPGDWMDAAYVKACGGGRTKDDYAPSSWHGTHVAGIVAAKADNGIGIAGVAPGVRVQPVRVLGHCGGTTWDTLLGIMWASGADLPVALDDPYYDDVPVNPTPADVINMSLGSTVTDGADRAALCDLYGQVVAESRARGTTVVAAAGNDSFTKNVSAGYSVPAACPGVISVGATSRTGHRSYYSQAGASVDISAPGGDEILDESSIPSTVNAGRTVPTAPAYEEYEGTSMAAPHVAAAAALLYSQGATSPTTVEQVLERSVTRFPARSSRYAAYTVTDGRKTYRLYDLNCTTTRCGAGILNLARLNPATGGTPTVGRTVSAEGWQTSRADVAYEWFATDDPATVIGTGRTLVVPTALLGRTLNVRMTVPGQDAVVVQTPTIARSTSATATSLPKSVSRKKRATLKVSVSGPVPVTGKVQVFDGRKRLTTRTLSKGKVTVLLPRLKKGRHTIKVVYSGSTFLTGSTSTRTITSK
jgi:serine protease